MIRSQSQHKKYNAMHYPGTRQICIICDCPTERCEEDALYIEDHGPICDGCYSLGTTGEELMKVEVEGKICWRRVDYYEADRMGFILNPGALPAVVGPPIAVPILFTGEWIEYRGGMIPLINSIRSK